MSFLFPKPEHNNPRNCFCFFHFDVDSTHSNLLINPEPDYDELLIRLSAFAFNPQEEIIHTPNVELNVELNVEDAQFYKLPCFHQLRIFLSKFIPIFKLESQEISASTLQTFTVEPIEKLSYYDQVRITLSEFIKRFEAERTGDEDYSATYYRNETSSNQASPIQEFFVGFSGIWFEGQSVIGQEMLIKQLEKGTEGLVVVRKRGKEESEEGFNRRRFKEMCMSIVDFRVQLQFLQNAKAKLEKWEQSSAARLIGEAQNVDSAAELLCSFWTFGFSLMSTKYQEQKIDELFTLQPKDDHHDQEGMSTKKPADLFKQLPVASRMSSFADLRTTLRRHKRFSKAGHAFKGLESDAQTEIIDYMFEWIKTHRERSGMELHQDEYIVEKISGESDEDFTFRRFSKLCFTHIAAEDIMWPETYQPQLDSESDDDSYPDDEFTSGVTTLWFKAKCTKMHRNPIQLILFGTVEIGDTIQKLPEESEEDYRLRRFVESFKQLDSTSQDSVMDYIEDTLRDDLGCPKRRRIRRYAELPPEGKGLFDPDWINYKPTNPRSIVAATQVTKTTQLPK